MMKRNNRYRPKIPAVERFISKFIVDKKSGCWVWSGPVSKDGYGIFRESSDIKSMAAHRASYRIFRGKIKEGMFICHKCDNPPCVNPDHLYVGTPQDNSNDMVKRNRSLAGEKNYKSKLNDWQVIKIRELWDSGELSQRDLAIVFGVTKTSIVQIVKRNSWKHI